MKYCNDLNTQNKTKERKTRHIKSKEKIRNKRNKRKNKINAEVLISDTYSQT